MSRIHARLCTLAAAVVAVMLLAASPARADADVRSEIKEKTKQAMENFDLLEFDEAKRLLNEAITLAKKKKVRDKTVASVYVSLGIVYFSGFSDKESAKLQFIEAVQIAGDVAIDKAYATDEMSQLLSEAREQYASGSEPAANTDTGDDDDDVDCEALEGLKHDLVDEAPAGRPAKIVVYVGSDLKAKKVSAFYRPKGTEAFVEVALKAKGCKFSGQIPGSALKGDMLHYYVAALDGRGKKVGNKGSKGSPNIMEIAQVGSGAFTDDENPLGNKAAAEPAPAETEGDVSSQVGPIGGPKQAKLFLSLAAGTGGGYVTGNTERVNSPVGCCFAPALLHVMPELGYYVSPQLAVSAAFRMGFPVGANINGHATGAPAGLIRVRYALDPSGDGISVSGAVGGGLLRHTVTIDNQPSDMNTDTTASGPLLVGGGAAYIRPLSGPMKFMVELNTLAAFAIVKEFGDCPDGDSCVKPSFGLQVDANIGILFAF